MAEIKDKLPLNNVLKAVLDASIEESKNDRDTEYIETCDVGLDLALTNGLGLPLGASVLLYAEPGCGKTTLLGDTSRRLIAQAKQKGEPFKVLYLASEGSRELLKKLGLEEFMRSGDFIYVEKPLTWRLVETYYEAVLQGYKAYKDVKMIVIDSINTVLSDQNQIKSVADGDFGSKAKERTGFYSKYLPRCAEKGVATFLVAQIRNNQDATTPYASKEKAAASFPDLHSVEIIIRCGKKTSLTETKKVVVKTVFGEVKEQKKYVLSLNSSAGNCKNRYFQGTPSEVMIIKGEGIDNTYAVRKILEGNGYLVNKGGWYIFNSSLDDLIPNVSSSKMRLEDANKIVSENREILINFLKQSNQYKLEISETEVDEEDDEYYEEEDE